jgi:hypothetical protein
MQLLCHIQRVIIGTVINYAFLVGTAFAIELKNYFMRKNIRVAIAAGLIIGLGIYAIRRVNINRKLRKVADNGYETAGDVLFPGKGVQAKKLRYGPIHPR